MKNLGVDPKWGLAEESAAQLLAQNGPNQLKAPEKISPVSILVTQIANALTIVLIAVSILTFD